MARKLRKKSELTLAKDSVQLKSYPQVFAIKPLAQEVWKTLRPGKNANNQLLRGIRWGCLVNGKFEWTQRNTYHLPETLNQEEKGRVRKFMLIPDNFIGNPIIEDILMDKFKTWDFPEPTDWRAYEVQVSLIGYVATPLECALPSPVCAHQDLVDGSVIVLDIEGEMDGGVTRVFDLNDKLITEESLGVGQSIFIKDQSTRHLVTPISVPLGSTTGIVKRLLMIVRFQPVGR